VTKVQAIGRLYGYNSLLSLGIGLFNLRNEKDIGKCSVISTCSVMGGSTLALPKKTTPKTKNQ
jgi:hypothetical protein